MAVEGSSRSRKVDDETELEDEPIAVSFSITSYGADYPVDGLVQRIRDESIFVPSFQRQFVWSQTQASRFIESLLLGLPVPGIFLAREGESNRSMVIDGQQRLKSLQYFYEGTFGRQAFELTGVASPFKGKRYSTLRPADKLKLDDSIIHATVVKQDRPTDDTSSTYLIFERLNSGATLLQPQEIRAAVYHGPFSDFLGRLNADENWRRVFGPKNDRLKDQELILRFLALNFDLQSYKKPMKEALNRFMRRNRNLQKFNEETLVSAFWPAIALVAEQLEQRAFRPVRNINAAVFDSVMVGLATRLAQGPVEHPKEFGKAYRTLLKEPEFKVAFAKSTSDEDQVRKRIELATRAFAEL
jgi:hypothetical protein